MNVEIPCCESIVTLKNIPPAGAVITCHGCKSRWFFSLERDHGRTVQRWQIDDWIAA